MAKRYRKRGLDKTAGRIVAFLEREGVETARVLEIGGGVGEIQLELLKRGAVSAVNLELSAAYDAEARALLREAGIDESRVTRRLHDIAEDPFSHPPRNVASRAFIRIQNLGLRISRKELRTYAHPPAAMLDVCRASGLRPTYAHAGVVWQVEGLSR